MRLLRLEGIMHYEFLSASKLIHLDLFCQQLRRLQQSAEKKSLETCTQKKKASFLTMTALDDIYLYRYPVKFKRTLMGSFNILTISAGSYIVRLSSVSVSAEPL